MARHGDKLKPGDRIPASGVYRVTHDTGHGQSNRMKTFACLAASSSLHRMQERRV